MSRDPENGRPDAAEVRGSAREQNQAGGGAKYRPSADQRAQAQDRLLRLAAASAQVGGWEWDVEHDHVECSELVGPLYGLPPGQPAGDSGAFIALCHPDDRAQLKQAIQEALDRKDEGYLVEHRVIWPDQSVHWLEVRGHVYRDASGRATRMAGTVIDVTRRKKAEANLIASEQLMRQLIAHAPAAIAMFDRELRYLQVSQRWLTDYQLQEQDLLGRCHYDVFPDVPQRWKEVHQRVLGGAVERCDEDPFPRADGKLEWLSWEVRPWTDSAGRIAGIVMLTQVITERKRTEEALRRAEEKRKRGEAERRELELKLQHAQRLEAVGRLAAGVAHDFNNVLSAITMNSDLLREALLPDHPGLEDVLEIRKAADRAIRLVRQLLAFSRQQVMEPRVIDLNELVANIELMLRRLAGESVLMSASYGRELWAVKADPSQIEQVLVNLTVNARDAMPEGGILSVETRNASFPEGRTVDHEPLAPGDYVAISVTDSGTGMDKATRARMFEPFFTTKDHGHGIGLGLSTVYGIVHQSSGVIDVVSEPGSGTRLTVLLPRVHEVISMPPSVGIPESSGGHETVLLVEDDGAVRQATRKILVGLGYRVLEAAHPSDALELVRVYVGPIDLLISDLVMPGMNGRELARALTALRPALRVLHMSGYADDIALREGMLAAGCAFIQKPFANALLASTVRSLLDSE